MRNVAFIAFAVLLALPAHEAGAGRVHPELEAKLASASPGDKIAVIVQMREQADPREIVSALPQKAARKLRHDALVKGLRERAARSQAALHADLARDQTAGEVERVIRFWVFNGMAMRATEGAIRRLAAREDVLEVRFDAEIPPPPAPTAVETGAGPTEWNIAQIRAPEVWAMERPIDAPPVINAPPYDGSGAVVGSFDTGVDGAHPDLSSNYRGNHAISWFDPYGQNPAPADFNGHGTHTTGTAVGGNTSGAHIGAAPGAKWIAAKAWNNSGSGATSAFHQIFEWFLAPGGDPANAPDVVNNSWGLVAAGCDTEFLPDILAWRTAEIFPSFAAGNSGPTDGSVRSPGALAAAFAVGATDAFDEVAPFSSRGPSPCNDVTKPKPDISAPGSNVRSAMPGGGYGNMSGTSMATPHATGAVAVLRSIKPSLSLDEIATILTLSSTDLGSPGADNAYGAGRLDLLVAAELTLRGFDVPLVRIAATVGVISETSTTPALVTVSRTGSTAQALEVKLSISGTATPGLDYRTLPGSVTIPAGAESATLPVVPLDDTELEVNENVLVTIVPDPAYIVSWSRTASVIITSDEQFPDLTVSALTVPSVAGAGEAVAVSETTTNRGSGAAPASVTRYFLSANTVLDAGDVVLGSRDVPALASGASSPATLSLTLPSVVTTGTWYVLAVADAAGSVPETSESNNTLWRQVRVGPDLDVLTVALPNSSGAGRSFSATESVKNVGAGTAAASVTQHFLSFNSTLDASDVLIGSRAVPALAAGGTSTGPVTLNIPEGIAAGNWYVITLADGGNAVAETNETNNMLVQTLGIGPDLDVTALSVPAIGGAGQSVTVSDTVSNQGGGGAAPSTTRYFLSSDLTLGAGDPPIGSRTVPGLEPGASESGSATLTIPADTATGTWYIIAEADSDKLVAESSELNNTFVRTIKIGPDLELVALTVPASAGAGSAITVTDTTKNSGAGDAPASLTHYVLSADSIAGAGDIPLGTRGVPALPAGASHSGTANLTLPGSMATGTWYVIAIADGSGVVPETYETNNTRAATVRIGPDLVVSSMTGPGAAGAGQTVTVAETTKNQGGGSAAATQTRYFMSADTLFDAGDVLLASREVPTLGAGESSAASVNLVIPADTGAGTRYVIAVADAGQTQSETSESNNTRLLAIRVGPDLSISTMSGPATADTGQSISVSDTVRNSGAGAASASVTRYYLSSNATFEATDTLLAARDVPALAGGATNSGNVVLTIPAGTGIGTWRIIALADADGSVAETAETNNAYVLTIRVGPDLSVSALSAPAFVAAGQTFAVTDTTRNLNTTPAPASLTQYFLSSNTTLDAGDILLGSRDVPALGASGSSSGSATVAIPADTPAGTLYVLALADGLSAVEEVSETNNVLSRSISVGADLVVSSFLTPSTGSAGQGISITETTRNQGAAAAGPSVTRYYLSLNTTVDAADVLLGSREVPALDAGASASGTLTLVLPANVTAGTWYIIARADAAETVPEASETNNLRPRAVSVSAP